MNDNHARAAQSRARLLDLVLVVTGPTMFAAGYGMFKGSPWFAAE